MSYTGKRKPFRKVSFAEWISAPLLVPKPPSAKFRVTIDLHPSNFATKKDERPMPNMDSMLLQTAGASFFAEAGLVHSYYQIELHPEDAHTHTFRGVNSHSLYEARRALEGFKNLGVHLHVHATELPAMIKENILTWLDDWLLQRKPTKNI